MNKRIALILMIIVALTSVLAPVSLAVEAPAVVQSNASSLKTYYNKSIKPYMDTIGTCMRAQIDSVSDLKSAFKKANTAVTKLEKAVKKKAKLKNDKTLMKYLSSLKTNIQEGHKRAKKVSSSDSQMLKYQQNAAKYLKKFSSRIQKLI